MISDRIFRRHYKSAAIGVVGSAILGINAAWWDQLRPFEQAGWRIGVVLFVVLLAVNFAQELRQSRD